MFIDTSIVIEIFRLEKRSKKFEKIHDIIKNEPMFISVIQLGEISDWCLSNGIDPSDRISKLKKIFNIIPLDELSCIEGSKIKFEMRKSGKTKFSLMDGIILASARSVNQKLLTSDSDFKKAEDVVFIK
jgi:predicted nucleic acid-binding protein